MAMPVSHSLAKDRGMEGLRNGRAGKEGPETVVSWILVHVVSLTIHEVGHLPRVNRLSRSRVPGSAEHH